MIDKRKALLQVFKQQPTLVRVRVEEHRRYKSHIRVHVSRVWRHDQLCHRARIIGAIVGIVGKVRLALTTVGVVVIGAVAIVVVRDVVAVLLQLLRK